MYMYDYQLETIIRYRENFDLVKSMGQKKILGCAHVATPSPSA